MSSLEDECSYPFVKVMAQLGFSGRGGGVAFPAYLNPNIFFQSTPDDPTPAIPTENVPVYILASVKNSGSVAANNATVQFWVCNPATAPTPSNSTLIGTSNVALDAGETKTVLCVTVWVPKWVNKGHECVICEISGTNDPSPAHPNTPWNLADRHVAQLNLQIVASPSGGGGLRILPSLVSMAAVGLHNETATKVTLRPAPEPLFTPALGRFGLRYRNVTKESSAGLISGYVAGNPLPACNLLPSSLDLKGVPPNNEIGFHTLIDLPDKDSESSAAMFLVEQHDAQGNVVGGVGVIVLGGRLPSKLAPVQAAAPAIPASIPIRPYSTYPESGFMTVDGIFLSDLGVQHINVETRNESGGTLQGLSMYVEGIADPNIATPIAIESPANGEALAGATFKSIFSADFTRAAAGSTVVSFIIQQQSGATSKSIRVLKKIFVLGIEYNKAKKLFTVNIPQGSLQIHIQTIIAPPKTPCSCGPGNGPSKCCCCGRPSGGDTDDNAPPSPILIKAGSLNWIPNPPYAGTHGPLPFDDPWWKVLFAIIAAALLIADTIIIKVDADKRSQEAADGTDPNNHCCDGVDQASNADKGTIAGVFAAAAAFATVAVFSDDADLHDRGQTQTPPKPGELTVSELVNFNVTDLGAPSPGTPFGGKLEWNYTRTLNNGRVLKYETKNDYSNIHYLKSYQVNVDGKHSDSNHYTHQRRDPLILGAQFFRPNGSLYRGAQLYVFAILFSDTGIKIGIELRDDGYGYLGGFDPPHDIPRLNGIAHADGTNPPGSAIAERGLVIKASMSAEQDNNKKANTGSYVAVTNIIARYPPSNWYLFVFSQDVNTVLEGTDPRRAAQTIGGAVLTNQFVFGLNGKPCELNYDAVITTV